MEKKKNVIITGHVYDDTIKKLIKLKPVKKQIAYIYIVKIKMNLSYISSILL